jgi:hypothetical protein
MDKHRKAELSHTHAGSVRIDNIYQAAAHGRALRTIVTFGLYARECEKDGRSVNVHVDGQLVFGTASLILLGARSGQGLVHLHEEQVKLDIEHGNFIRP